MLLWAVVLIEIVSPVPAFLTFGVIWILLTRPAWLPGLVGELYAEDARDDE